MGMDGILFADKVKRKMSTNKVLFTIDLDIKSKYITTSSYKLHVRG